MEKFGKCQFMDAEEISSGKQTFIDSPHHSPVTITLIIHHPKFPTVVKVVMCSRGGGLSLCRSRRTKISIQCCTQKLHFTLTLTAPVYPAPGVECF